MIIRKPKRGDIVEVTFTALRAGRATACLLAVVADVDRDEPGRIDASILPTDWPDDEIPKFVEGIDHCFEPRDWQATSWRYLPATPDEAIEVSE